MQKEFGRQRVKSQYAKDMQKEAVLIIHNIRSVYNVGALFRTADAVGISKIILSGYTPAPIDRFGRKRNDFHKCALGSEDSVSWEVSSNVEETIGVLKKGGYVVVGLEQSDQSVDYKEVEVRQKTAVIIGSEVGGMDPELLAECDIVAEIPMKGMKDSLNVSVATGVLLYRLFDR